MSKKPNRKDPINIKMKLKKDLSYLLDVILSNIVLTTILSIPSAIGGIIYVTKVFSAVSTGNEISPHNLVIAGICTLFCLLSLFSVIIFFLYHLLHKEPSGIQFPPLENSYRLKRMECELFFQDRSHILQRLTIHYEVTAETLEAIPHTIHWTGSGYKPTRLDQKSLGKGYRLKEKKKSASTFGFEIVFPEKKNKGYTDSYRFETEVEDANCVMLPTLSWLIKCESDDLILKITAPPGVIESCEHLVSVDFPCDFILSDPQSVEPELVGNNYCYKHSFTDLELLRYYMLRWEWAGAEANSN